MARGINNKGSRVDVNLDGWKEIKKALINTAGRVRVGVLSSAPHIAQGGDQQSANPISLIELAAIHEFGSPAAGIPERSFMRSTLQHKRPALNAAIDKFVGQGIKNLLDSDSTSGAAVEAEARRALAKVGQTAVAMIRATIRERATTGPEPQENSSSTIARKGSTLPLVDTGQLINGLTYEVVNKGDAS